MNNVLFLHDMTIDIIQKQVDNFTSCSGCIVNNKIKITLFDDDLLDFNKLVQTIQYIKTCHNNYKLEIIAIINKLDENMIHELLEFKDILTIHYIVNSSYPLFNNEINIVSRLIVDFNNVNELYDKVTNLRALGYTSFFIQRIRLENKIENDVYYNDFIKQKKLIDSYNDINIDINFPKEFNLSEYFFKHNENVKLIYSDKKVEMVLKDKQTMTIPLIVSETCNLNCKYCYVKHRNEQNLPVISSENIQLLPSFLTGLLNKIDFIYLDIFGGEPLVYWDKCKEIIECLETFSIEHPNNLKIRIFTNATLITQEILNYVKRKKYVDFHFSLDGNKESNKTRIYANGNETYDDINKNLELYFKTFYKDKNDILCQFVISPYNVSNFYNAVVDLYNEGYRKFSMNVTKENNWDENTLRIYEEQYNKVANFIIDKLLDNKIFYCSYFFEPKVYELSAGVSLCDACARLIGIGPDGNIYPCQRFYNNRSGITIGNLKDGINEDDKMYQKIMNYPHSNTEKCKGCKLEGFCYTHCFAAQYENGNMFEYIDSICTINKINYATSDYMHNKLKTNDIYKALIQQLFLRSCCQ